MDELASKLLLFMCSFGRKSYLNKAIAAFICTLCVLLKQWSQEQMHNHICNTFMVHAVYIPSLIFIPISTVHSTLTFACLSYPMLSCVYPSLSCVYPFLSRMCPISFSVYATLPFIRFCVYRVNLDASLLSCANSRKHRFLRILICCNDMYLSFEKMILISISLQRI